MTGRPDTRERIRGAAATLFREKGFHGSSMLDLAEVVGITKSSLYHHFPSKQALLSEIIEGTVARVTPMVQAITESNQPAAERLHMAVRLHTLEAIRDQDAVGCFIEEGRYLAPTYLEAHVMSRDRYEGFFRQILTDGIATGEFRSHDVPLAAMAILGLCNSVVRWYRPGAEHTPEEIAEEFASLVVRGVLEEQGQRTGIEEVTHQQGT